MKAIYEFSWDCGRMGDVTGLFIADKETVAAAIGRVVYFGEILGKHSDVQGTLEVGDLTIKSDDQDFICKFEEIFGINFYTGHNPLHYLAEEND